MSWSASHASRGRAGMGGETWSNTEGTSEGFGKGRHFRARAAQDQKVSKGLASMVFPTTRVMPKGV